jgi:methyltransferase (TIGR00027 family)
MEPVLRDIADTARWVAFFRAEESERADAVFRDPFARRLAGERGQQIAEAVAFSRANSWSFVARTHVFDRRVDEHVAAGYDTILNLAAGLDARPYRMALPSTLRWVEVDLPAMVGYKNSMLIDAHPRCRLERVALDLAARDERKRLFEDLNRTSTRVFVMTEGLVGYLADDEVGSLAADLSGQSHFRRWALDLLSPGLVALAKAQMGSILNAAFAPLRFGPSEGEDFFRQYGWTPLESTSLLKTAAVLNRVPPHMQQFAAYPEPEGPKGEMPWSGVCLFENGENGGVRS